MKLFQRFIFPLIAMSLLAASFYGCEKKGGECPFTTITWENTPEDITGLEGDGGETYDSIYDGITYAYPKEYEGLPGTVKYMFDGENKLVSMSWMYETEDPKDLEAVYEKIHGEAEKMLGKSGYKYNREELAKIAAPGDVWYRKSGNIVITTVNASDLKALQYTFLHPDVSEEQPRDNA